MQQTTNNESSSSSRSSITSGGGIQNTGMPKDAQFHHQQQQQHQHQSQPQPQQMAPPLSSSAVHHHHYQQFEQQQQQHQQQHHLGTDSKSPTADDSAEKKDDKSAPVRKRLSLACTTCRQRKVKCDGGRPSCRTCAKFNWPCVYQPSNRKRGPRPRALALMDGSIPYMNRSHWPASHSYYVYGFPGQSPPPPPPQHYMAPFFGQPPDAPMNGAPVRMEASLMQPGGYNHDTYTTYGDYMTNSGSIRIRPPPPMRSPVNQSAPHMPMRVHPRQHYPHRIPGPMGMSGPPLPPPLVMPQRQAQHHHPHHIQPPPHATRPLMQYAEQNAHGQMAGHRAQSPFSPTSSAGFSPHSGQPLYTLPEPHLFSLATSAAPVHRYAQKLTSPVQISPSNAGQPPLQSPVMHAQYADSRQRGAQGSDARRNDPGSALSLASASDNNTSAAVSLKLIGEGSRQMGAYIVSRNAEAESEVLGGISSSRNSGGSGGGLPNRSSLRSPAPQRMHSSAQSRDSASNYAPDMQPQSTNASMHLSAIYAKGKADITNRSVESSNGVRFAHPQPSTPANLSGHRQAQPMCVKDDSTLSLPMQRSENSRAAVETPMSVPIPSTAAFPPSRLHYTDKQQHYRGQYQQSSVRHSLPEPEPHIVQRQEHVCSPQISPKPALFGSGDSRPRLPPLSEVFGRDYQFMRSPDNLSLAAEVLVLPLASAGIRSEHPTPSLAHGKDSFRGSEASKMGC